MHYRYLEPPLYHRDIAAFSYLNTFFMRNAGSLRICLVLSQSLVVSRFIPLVAPLYSVQCAFHKTFTKTFSTIVYLEWYFQRMLMKAMSGSLGVSMSYFSGGRLKMNERRWETSEESGVAPTTDSTVNFTLDTNGNVINNFKKEYQKVTMLDSSTQDSINVSEFRQTLFWRATLRMSVSHQLAKQSSDNCYRTIQWRMHVDIVCKNYSWSKIYCRKKFLWGSSRVKEPKYPLQTIQESHDLRLMMESLIFWSTW